MSGTAYTRSATDPRVVGGTYWCGYWRETFVVLSIRAVAWGREYRVRRADGHETTHSTEWDRTRDRVVDSGGAS